MAHVFRVRRSIWCLMQAGQRVYRTPDGRRVTKDTPGAVKADLGWSEYYFGKVPGPDGKPVKMKLCTDKKASKEMLAKLVTDGRMRAVGLADPFETEHTAAAGRTPGRLPPALAGQGGHRTARPQDGPLRRGRADRLQVRLHPRPVRVGRGGVSARPAASTRPARTCPPGKPNSASGNWSR